MVEENKLSYLEGFKLFVLLMIFVEIGGILSHLTFDRTIFIFNASISIIGFTLIVIHFIINKKILIKD